MAHLPMIKDSKYMNWKEQFEKYYGHDLAEIDKTASENIQHFISKEIIERLINDIPDESFNEDGYFMQNNKPLKQQLKSRWLGKE